MQETGADAPAAPVTTPLVMVEPCSAPKFFPALMMGVAAPVNPSMNSPAVSRWRHRLPLASPAAIATGVTATALTFSQNSLLILHLPFALPLNTADLLFV